MALPLIYTYPIIQNKTSICKTCLPNKYEEGRSMHDGLCMTTDNTPTAMALRNLGAM